MEVHKVNKGFHIWDLCIWRHPALKTMLKIVQSAQIFHTKTLLCYQKYLKHVEVPFQCARMESTIETNKINNGFHNSGLYNWRHPVLYNMLKNVQNAQICNTNNLFCYQKYLKHVKSTLAMSKDWVYHGNLQRRKQFSYLRPM